MRYFPPTFLFFKVGMAQNHVFWDGKGVKMKKITFFDKKVEKNFVGSEKSITFALAIKK